MSLKLFRSTGYASILSPGETRIATHPGWMILAVSLWIGFVCNVALWRELRSLAGPGLGRALWTGLFIAAACGALLSLLGWRRTLKHSATLLLALAALVAASIWVQQLPIGAGLLDQGLRAVRVPSWSSLLRGQFPVLLAGLGLLPMIWVWQLKLRRLPGPRQLSANVTAMLVYLTILAGAGWLIGR